MISVVVMPMVIVQVGVLSLTSAGEFEDEMLREVEKSLGLAFFPDSHARSLDLCFRLANEFTIVGSHLRKSLHQHWQIR